MERIYGSLMFPRVVIVLAMLLALVMLVVAFRAALREDIEPRTLWKIFIFWTAAPPFWFALEYFWLYKQFGTSGTFDAFKYGQENAQKFWAAILALLGARLFKEVQAGSQSGAKTKDSATTSNCAVESSLELDSLTPGDGGDVRE